MPVFANIPDIDIGDFSYDLPPDRIADRPTSRRDGSRLLVVRRGAGVVADESFVQLGNHLPPESLLVRNTTRVVQARLDINSATGGRIEILLLDPLAPSRDPGVALAATLGCRWRALIGGARKARREPRRVVQCQTRNRLLQVEIALFEEPGLCWYVDFNWSDTDVSFAEILGQVGSVPLPPYLNRSADERDRSDYQTVYAAVDGAVAAPTAGLHFSDDHLRLLESQAHRFVNLTLHVGAGTFQPVAGRVVDHRMHHERIVVPVGSLRQLVDSTRTMSSEGIRKAIIAVGTTSMRVLESLYWFGVRMLHGQEPSGEMMVGQWEPYRLRDAIDLPAATEALEAVVDLVNNRGESELAGATELMIVPGYRFMVCDGLITNFHQPKSTLMLLVAAFIGAESWRDVYKYALSNEYRFLSYGDSSLILPDQLH